jgi:probable HAF family extracellular repeat protein
MLAELTDWLGKKSPDMATPPNSEPKPAATARAVLYMSLYVYNGPETPPPTYSPNADAVTGLVTPGAPATIVTPTKHAGVQFEAGSVDETTIIVITQNLTPYPQNCSGPLQTKLCQYPQFYTFEQFPHKTLLKPAKFNACHINAGPDRRPLADHDRFRLAHSKPADPADYTPGSVIRDQNGESIEILPLVPQTFSTCENSEYTQEMIASGSMSLVSRLARAAKKIVTPRTAYAIDLGLGGLSRSMSPFNDVDPLSQPDLSINSIVLDRTEMYPGDHVSIRLVVSNTGTATQSTVGGVIYLTPPPPVVIEGPPQPVVDRQIGSIALPALVPGTVDTIDVDAPIPFDVGSGDYQIKVVLGNDPVLSDLNPANNVATRSISLDANIIDLGTLTGDDASVGLAINAAGHAVGFSGITPNAHPFLWTNGQMTALPTLGGNDGEAQGINDSDEIVGYSKLASGENRAVRWANGTVTNLGTLPGMVNSNAVAINSSGQIVGWSTSSDLLHTRGWIWQNGIMTDLGLLPGGTYLQPAAINDAGVIVGVGDSESGVRGWRWENGELSEFDISGRVTGLVAINQHGLVAGFMDLSPGVRRALVQDGTVTDLGVLEGDTFSTAAAVSDDQTVVGVSSGSGAIHAFVWRNGQMSKLGTVGGLQARPFGISNNGQAIGISTNAAGKQRATIWRIAPAPVIP